MHGQWQRIPTPDEMQEAWAVYDKEGKMWAVGSTEDDVKKQAHQRSGVRWEDMELGFGDTCKPVSIVPRESEVEG